MFRGMTDGISPEAADPSTQGPPQGAPADTRQLGRRLIDALGRGWSRGRPDDVAVLFADEAVFVETPFSEPTRGREAIHQWWREVPYNQSEITFTSGEIYAAGPWFSCEFKCVFRRRRTGEWVDARGAIFCETDGERITEMRMYWHRWNGGRETSKA
jgi:ketosteroid isomerase-like protein